MHASHERAVASEPDSILLTRLLEGEERALSELYDRFAPTLYALSLRITRDREAAGQILENVFARFWEDREQSCDPRPTDPLSTRLLRICRTRSLSWLRGVTVGPEPVPPGSGAADVSTPDPPFRGDVDPAVGIARLEPLARRVVAALAVAQLAPLGRRALELLYFQGAAVESIARRLNIQASRVPEILRAAQAELRDRLAAALPVSEDRR